MVLVLEGSRSEIDKPDFCVQQHTSLRRLSADSRRGRRYLAVVGECLIVVAAEQDVLRLEVRVDQVQIV